MFASIEYSVRQRQATEGTQLRAMDNTTVIAQLGEQAKHLREIALKGDVAEVKDPIGSLLEEATTLSEVWSGSNLGHQSHIYHRNFTKVPAGSHYSSEWGSYPALSGGTTGDWVEYDHDAVISYIEKRAGKPNLTAAEAASKTAIAAFKIHKSESLSILAVYLAEHSDSYLQSLSDKVAKVEPLSAQVGLRAQMPSGRLWSRDTLALSQGPQAAPHQHVIAHMTALREPFIRSSEVADLVEHAASHISRVESVPTPAGVKMGNKVFIGHGGTLLWRELKDFISDRLKLSYDEFNRVPVAGVHTTDRLKQMLDEAGIAFLVMTAEDERADGKMTARQNVIHEVGLFQGRLGFERAIVVLEEGCEEFSNITGLSQIRFPKGNIRAAFEEIRQVLEREGFLA